MKGHLLKSKEFRATGKVNLKFALRVSRLSVRKNWGVTWFYAWPDIFNESQTVQIVR